MPVNTKQPNRTVELLKLAYPLMFTAATYWLMQFIDRLFLAWYSPESNAACVSAGMTSNFIAAFFIGVIYYLEVFVAHYHGSRRDKDIGKILWVGFYVATAAGLLLILLIPLTRQIFLLNPSSPQILVYEQSYFTILQYAMGLSMIGDVGIGFYTGRGKMFVLLWVLSGTVLMNIILDYILIFGYLGFPALGIVGAGYATAIAIGMRTILFLVLTFQKKNRDRYHTFRPRSFSFRLLFRLFQFGAPAAAQMMLELGALTIFVLLIRGLGEIPHTVTGLALSLHLVAIIPIDGLKWALIVLVGQYRGKKDTSGILSLVKAGFKLNVIYSATVAFLYIMFPRFFLGWFQQGSTSLSDIIMGKGEQLMGWVALFVLGDTCAHMAVAALSGVGDTRAVMVGYLVAGWLFFLPVTYLAIHLLGFGLFWSWGIAVIYLAMLTAGLVIRFFSRRWLKISLVN